MDGTMIKKKPKEFIFQQSTDTFQLASKAIGEQS
jgi:hypothetical protein